MSKDTKICLLAPTESLLRKSRDLVEQYHKDVLVYQASLANALPLVKNLLKGQDYIFISRRGTKKIIEDAYQARVVPIETSLSDYVPVMEVAAQKQGLFAFFTYGAIPENIRTMCQLLKIKARFFVFHNLAECEAEVKEAVSLGAVLGVGGADTGRFADRYLLPHIVVENSETSLLNAIEAAEQLLKTQEEEKLKQEQLKFRIERYELVFNFTQDAVISVDKAGKIQLLNSSAETLFKGQAKLSIGDPVKALIPGLKIENVLKTGQRELDQLMRIKGHLLDVSKLPIKVNNKVLGVLLAFHDVKVLQEREEKIRIKLSEKGLIAKHTFADIWGQAPNLLANIALAEKFARAGATILLQGETGTGKELFAQSIHNASPRRDEPFVAVNCGAFPRNLLEAELFGYVEGAFTGASKGGKMGLFEMAHHGTIFLDEIGEMPLETQVQLLRVLQEKEIRRIGSDHVTPVDIRVIAATNRNLLKDVGEQRFREDLYYRLNVLNVTIPPVRERKGDVELIGKKYFEKMYPEELSEADRLFVGRLFAKYKDYPWPGNVREIRNMVERVAILRSQGESNDFVELYLEKYLLPSKTLAPVAAGKLWKGGTPLDNTQDLGTRDKAKSGGTHEEADGRGTERAEAQPGETRGSLSDWEKQKIITALRKNNLEMLKTAQELQMSRSTLWRKIKKYGIEL